MGQTLTVSRARCGTWERAIPLPKDGLHVAVLVLHLLPVGP